MGTRTPKTYRPTALLATIRRTNLEQIETHTTACRLTRLASESKPAANEIRGS
jgi:hypothetical protein